MMISPETGVLLGKSNCRWYYFFNNIYAYSLLNKMKEKRIFLLDDEQDMTLLTEALLRRKGFDVTISNEPVQALIDLEKADFDAIVVDLMMPKLSGLKVIEDLRSRERHKSTPVLVMSAKRLEDEERRSLLEFNARFLAKPVSPTRLVQAVEEAVEKLKD